MSAVPPSLGSFGDRLRTLRLDHAMTRAELAERIGVTPTCLYQWEIGRNRPLRAAGAYERLAEALQCSIDFLTTGSRGGITVACGVCERPITGAPPDAGPVLCPLCAANPGLVSAFREGLTRKASGS